VTDLQNEPVADPVNDTRETAVPETADAQGAPDALDEYLARFDAAAQPESVPNAPEPTPVVPEQDGVSRENLSEVIGFVNEQRAKTQREEYQKALDQSVKTFKEASGTDLADDLIAGYLESVGNKNEAFARAFGARGKNPQAWNGALKALAQDFSKTHGGQPAPDVDASRAAVRQASARSASTAAPEDNADFQKRVAKMTDAEVNEMLMKEFGYSGNKAFGI